MIKFYQSIPQAKFAIMISLYRAFAEDSRERLYQMKNTAHSTPFYFLLNLKKELASLKGVTKGMTEDHFYE